MSLGCPDGYTVELRTRDGLTKLAALDGVLSVRWSRVRTDTSEATIVVQPRSPECSGWLGVVAPWMFGITVWRGPELVWEGPLFDVDESGSTVTLLARDVSAWLGKRILHQGYELNDVDLVQVGGQIVTDAFAPDDPNVIRHLRLIPTGVRVVDAYTEPETGMADAHLDDLVGLGLEWTVVGRRIIMFGRQLPLFRLPALGASAFTGPLPVVRPGGSAVTRMVVQGGGVRGEAGGVHPEFGLLEELVTAAGLESDEDAAQAARQGIRWPRVMLSGADLALSPRAPVGIGQLIPGAEAVVSGQGAITAVSSAVMELTKLTVDWTPAGEVVTPTFEAVNR